MRKSEGYEHLREQLDSIPVIDTHEHIRDLRAELGAEIGLSDLLLQGYIYRDLLSAGMPGSANTIADRSLPESWEFRTFLLDYVRDTGYYQALKVAFRDLFDWKEGDISQGNWKSLSERVTAANRRPAWMHNVMKDRCHIDVALLDPVLDIGTTEVNRNLFAPVLRVDPFFYGYDLSALEIHGTKVASIYRRWDTSFDTFDGFLEMIENAMASSIAGGAVALKLAVAYFRSLRFENIEKAEAGRIFAKGGASVSPDEIKQFQDFIMHYLLELSLRYEIPWQIHTGGHVRTDSVLSDSEPVLLINLFQQYPEIRFVLFHGGFPYWEQAGILAKTFANVYLDLCWIPLLSPSATKTLLHHWLDLVPCNKIMWGGDAHYVEECYGALEITKDIIAEVLNQKVDAEQISMDRALNLASKIFHDNAKDLYCL